MRIAPILAVVLLAIAAFMTVSAGQARAAGSFNVTTLSDSGPGSLRQAIVDANAAGGTNVINIQVNGTIMVSSAQLPDITQPLSIVGPGQDLLTVDVTCTPCSGFVFATGIKSQISGLTITGASNTAISSDATALMLSDVIVTSNAGGVSLADGLFELSNVDSKTTSFGSGTTSGAASVTLLNATVTGNTQPTTTGNHLGTTPTGNVISVAAAGVGTAGNTLPTTTGNKNNAPAGNKTAVGGNSTVDPSSAGQTDSSTGVTGDSSSAPAAAGVTGNSEGVAAGNSSAAPAGNHL